MSDLQKLTTKAKNTRLLEGIKLATNRDFRIRLDQVQPAEENEEVYTIQKSTFWHMPLTNHIFISFRIQSTLRRQLLEARKTKKRMKTFPAAIFKLRALDWILAF